VDLEDLHPRERERLRGAARAELGCRPRDTVFLVVGGGDLQVAIEAARHEALWVVVAGEQPKTSGFPERVRFVGRRDDLRPLYAAADCLLDFSQDASPDSVLEALAMGLPAIASTRSGAAELIEPGVNGWLCEPEDESGLARLFIAAEAAARAGGMDRAARATAERFGADATARQVSELYASL
jgi:UDP-glucose:(heptosyl)LPS alpha-1,3-glucosyltransferase